MEYKVISSKSSYKIGTSERKAKYDRINQNTTTMLILCFPIGFIVGFIGPTILAEFFNAFVKASYRTHIEPSFIRGLIIGAVFLFAGFYGKDKGKEINSKQISAELSCKIDVNEFGVSGKFVQEEKGENSIVPNMTKLVLKETSFTYNQISSIEMISNDLIINVGGNKYQCKNLPDLHEVYSVIQHNSSIKNN